MISPVQLHMSPSLAHQYDVPGALSRVESAMRNCETSHLESTVAIHDAGSSTELSCQHRHPFPLHRSLEIHATYTISCHAMPYHARGFDPTRTTIIISPGHTEICSVKKTGTLWFGIAPALYPPQVLLIEIMMRVGNVLWDKADQK